MNERIKVKKADVRPILAITFPDYAGRSFEVELTDRVTFHDTNWGGGSRTYYQAVSMGKGKAMGVPAPAPWVNPFEGKTVELTPDIVVVAHRIFCGHDLGIVFYAHPTTAPKWLTA